MSEKRGPLLAGRIQTQRQAGTLVLCNEQNGPGRDGGAGEVAVRSQLYVELDVELTCPVRQMERNEDCTRTQG